MSPQDTIETTGLEGIVEAIRQQPLEYAKRCRDLVWQLAHNIEEFDEIPIGDELIPRFTHGKLLRVETDNLCVRQTVLESDAVRVYSRKQVNSRGGLTTISYRFDESLSWGGSTQVWPEFALSAAEALTET